MQTHRPCTILCLRTNIFVGLFLDHINQVVYGWPKSALIKQILSHCFYLTKF